MDTVNIIIIVFAFSVLAVRMYLKYVKKAKGKKDADSKSPPGNILSSSSADDDYEPYSKK